MKSEDEFENISPGWINNLRCDIEDSHNEDKKIVSKKKKLHFSNRICKDLTLHGLHERIRTV